MFQILIALLPDFSLIALGGALRLTLSPDAWKGIDKLNFQVLFPALIFTAALSKAPDAGDVLVVGVGVWLIIGLGFCLAWPLRSLGPERFLDFAGLWQTAWRFNTALAFVAVQTLPETHRALMSIAIGMAVPLANVLAIGALSRGHALSLPKMIRQIVTNPFFVASVAGMALSMLRVDLSPLLLKPVRMLAMAAIPIALLSIGASLNWRALARVNRFSVALNAIKLLILPAATWALATAIGIDPVRTTVLTLFAALPTASAAHVLASVFGADREAVATLIAQSTLIGCVSLPMWLVFLNGAA
ncbi:AEC family transporter [Xanthobacter dioxanivorans]|uniref:AEC family transporter n=1 Tax=Xanthobacter dioxanivorans TaxID=2528964 RepID=A0A974PN48_9HYPH|nr:AEC family transporter [Xanthobacter dioxanivorans]QRG06286.1 AEC family transporter [Xanthobacter dioxanivorans]